MQITPLYHNLWDRLFLKKAGRRESENILGAILTHAGFNFAMVFLMFYAL